MLRVKAAAEVESAPQQTGRGGLGLVSEQKRLAARVAREEWCRLAAAVAGGHELTMAECSRLGEVADVLGAVDLESDFNTDVAGLQQINATIAAIESLRGRNLPGYLQDMANEIRATEQRLVLMKGQRNAARIEMEMIPQMSREAEEMRRKLPRLFGDVGGAR